MKYIFRMFCLAFVVTFYSCSKHTDMVTPTPATVSHLATLGLYEASSGTSKRIFLPITGVGTQALTTTYYSIFDTGSTGLTLDATGILPASMITSNGITVPGDSVVVNGITVTSKTSVMSYGDQTGITKEYGNVAYATFNLGDANGSIITRRIPFFLYYKIVNTTTGVQAAAHSADVFGVGPGTSYASTLIASPLSYFDLGTGLTGGFRLALLSSTNFTTNGTYVAGLLSIGLLPSDISSSSGFVMHPFGGTSSTGYTSEIPATITYGSQTVSNATVIFDTGTPAITIIEDKTATGIGPLSANTKVTVTTNKGFVYSYNTASTANLTSIQNPNVSGDYRTIFSLDFFISNEYLIDYTDHQIGLKNN